MLDYNPILPDIQKVIQRHVHLLRSSPELLEIFPSKSLFPPYRRTKNLKDILAPSKFGGDGEINQAGREMGGCLKCSSRCDLCKNFLIQDSKFKSFSTGRTYKINQNLSCSSKNVVLASYIKCNLQYVGSTSTDFKVRFRNHKSAMLTNKKTCELAVHFNCIEHDISELVSLLQRKLPVRATQLTLIDCYLPEKPSGPHNYARLVLTVLTKGANSDLKIVSAIIAHHYIPCN